MGLDVYIRPKNRDYDHSIDGKLSRRFCNFLCGPDAFENSEFIQVQTLFDIDLSIFRRYAVNIEPNIHELEYQLYLAEEENDQIKVEKLQQQIVQVKVDWDKNYDQINEGWTSLDELEFAVKSFQEKLVSNLDYHKQLKYNFDWGDYFLPEREPEPCGWLQLDEETRQRILYVRNILLEDLQSIVNSIKEARTRDILLVTFDYG